MSDVAPASSEITISRPSEDLIVIHIYGEWKLGNAIPPADEVKGTLESGREISRLSFDTTGLSGWDSGSAVKLPMQWRPGWRRIKTLLDLTHVFPLMYHNVCLEV